MRKIMLVILTLLALTATADAGGGCKWVTVCDTHGKCHVEAICE